MKIHRLKTIPKYFEQVLAGTKTFELRRDDRGFQVGDVLVLDEYHEMVERYSGRSRLVAVTSILRDFPGLAPGFVVLSISNRLDDVRVTNLRFEAGGQ